MATDKLYWYDKICGVLEKYGPLQISPLVEKLEKSGEDVKSHGNIRTLVSIFVKQYKLYKYKVPSMHTFYILPHWISNGKLKINFDPYTKKYIRDGTTDNTLRIS